MLNSIHLLSSSGFYGAESAVLELTKGLRTIGASSSVVIFETGNGISREIKARFLDHGISVDILSCHGKVDFTLWRRLRNLAFERDVQIVHSHKYKTTPYALLAARNTSFAVISTYHNWLAETRALSVYTAIDKALARFCDANVAVSYPIAMELSKWVRCEQVFKIENGVDVQKWSPVSSESISDNPSALTIGFVGRMTGPKGVDRFLEAVATTPVIQSRPVHALLVGSGDAEERLRIRALRDDLVGRVKFAGVLSDVAEAYAQMDVIVLPSDNEGFPMVLLEAMAMGIPVIASNVGDVSLLAETGCTGVLLSNTSSKSIAAAFEDVLANTAHTRTLGSNSRKRIVSDFSSIDTATKYLDVYQKVLGRK